MAQEGLLVMLNQSHPLPQLRLAQEESPYLEPGLLAVFRLAVLLEIAVQLVSITFGIFFESGVVWETFASIVLGGFLLTLGYLSWPRLWRTLGRAYLPLGLLLVAAVPLLERGLFVYFQLQRSPFQLTPQEIFDIAWRLIIGFFVPLTLAAWQYRWRIVLVIIALFFLATQGMGIWLLGLKFYQMRDLVELTFILTMLFVIIGYIMTQMVQIQHKQRQVLIDTNAQLAAANRQLAAHIATVEKLAIVRERNRMARDLHDTLAQTLIAVAVQLEAADSLWDATRDTRDQARVLLVKSIGLAQNGLAETRRAIQALRATPVEDLGLSLAIRTLAESIAARMGAHLELSLAVGIDLPPQVEQTIYRIAQEALNNVVKHAHAQTLRVALEKCNQGLLLVIVDDGVGFARDQVVPDGHYGLQGLREQAQLIGAQLQIESQLQQGTTVRLCLERV